MKMHVDSAILEPPRIDDGRFFRVREATEALYKETQAVQCPYLKADVHFNVAGLEHMKFRDWGKVRERNDQFFRLKLFEHVPDILRRSHTLQGKWETQGWERKKSRGKWIKILTPVAYHEFVAVVGKLRIKVIVKQVNGGQMFFWSIIPFWRMQDLSVAEGEKPKRRRILYDGDPETD